MLQQWTRDILGVSYLHQRPDRDEYVVIRKNNIEEEKLKYFEIVNTDEERVKYDFGSILHPPYSASYKFYQLYNRLLNNKKTL